MSDQAQLKEAGEVNMECWRERTHSWRNFVAALRRIVHKQMWREFLEPTMGILRHETFTQYVTDFLELDPKSLPYVIEGTDNMEFADEVRTILRREEPKLNGHGGARTPATEQDSGTTLLQERGTSYNVRRLKRDRPDLYQQVIDGTLTPNAAAIQAGFRRKVVKVRADDVDRAVTKLLEHYTPEQLLAAIAHRGSQ
jgi:hypothetical protein